MGKLVLFIASSLDGYIARSSGEVDWLFTDQDYGYTDFFAKVDTVLMGRCTYEQVLLLGEFSYHGVQQYVFSKTLSDRRDNFTFISSDSVSFIQGLKRQAGQDIWLIGGAKLIQSCLQANLIDEFIISIHPLILGEGIPLFITPLPTTSLKLQRCKTYETGLVQLTYTNNDSNQSPDYYSRQSLLRESTMGA